MIRADHGRPHMLAADHTSAFERCMSDVTVAIGRLERLPADLSPGQRHRLAAAAARLAATIKEQEQ